MDEAQPTTDLEPDRVSEMVSAGEAQLVDVRTAEEREAARIPDSVHLPLDRLSQEAERVERERPVVFYCRSGDRSAVAAEAFRTSGWDAYNLGGGIVAWAERGLPVEPEGDVPPRSRLPEA